MSKTKRKKSRYRQPIPRRDHDELYASKYGDVPDEAEKRLEILFDTPQLNRIKRNVEATIEDFKKIKRRKLTFIWYTEPHPSQRPRANFRGGHIRMYVPLAAETKEDFQKFMAKTFPDWQPISTPMSFHVKAYLKTPQSAPRSHKILAELGIIRPWGRVADCDNILKAYTDCTIGSLIADDDMIDDMRSEKFYSSKPRVEFEIIYYERWPKGLTPVKYEEVLDNVRSEHQRTDS
jgi:Holliday junction resolvase RusA-like endonuclease